MISVCIATYNGEKYIRPQLVSVLSQLSANDEVIVSDDSSTDGTLEIVRSLNDGRIKIVTHRRFPGKFNIDYSTHNFENSLQHAKGDVIFLADQDDVWLEGKVKAFLRALERYDCVVSDCKITDGDLNVICPSYHSQRPFSSSILRNIWKSSFLGCTMAFKRNVLDCALPFPPYGVAHDIWIGIVAKMYFSVGLLPQPYSLYRRHRQTVTLSAQKNTNSISFMVKYRLQIIAAIIRKMLAGK